MSKAKILHAQHAQGVGELAVIAYPNGNTVIGCAPDSQPATAAAVRRMVGCEVDIELAEDHTIRVIGASRD